MLKNFRNFSTTNVARDKIRHTIKAAFGKYLLWTNTASCGVLMFLGDLIDQEIHYRKKVDKTWRYDYMRLGTRSLFRAYLLAKVNVCRTNVYCGAGSGARAPLLLQLHQCSVAS